MEKHLQVNQLMKYIINLIEGKRIIIPNVEILSANSVQLTWNNEMRMKMKKNKYI